MFDMVIDGGIARLSLSRPQARNAIPLTGWKTLGATVGKIADIGARVLVVRSSEPSSFCAGADIHDFAALSDDPALRVTFRTEMRAALDGIASLPIPTIAAIDGGCFGAGVALALACDIRLAGPGARFSVPPARLGISYPQEDVTRLVRLIGAGQAARLLFCAAMIDSAEAERIGLSQQAGSADDAATELARMIAANSPSSIRLLKQAIIRAVQGERSSAIADAAFDDSFASSDFAEGLDAFRARRAPEFGE